MNGFDAARLIGARILTPCPAGLVVGGAVVHLYVGKGQQAVACPVCEGKGQILQDPNKFAQPNIGYDAPGEQQDEQPAGPRLVVS